MVDFFWWIFLIASLILIMREMGKWVSSRTKMVDTWMDTPRHESPVDEIEEVADQFKGYSERRPEAMSKTRQIILDAIGDRICAKLHLKREDLDRLLRDPVFLLQNFGEYPFILRYLRRTWLTPEKLSNLENRGSEGKESSEELLREIRDMLDSVERWEKEP
jgi:hypothetical protein